jgi:hypothetical protein
MNLNTLAVPFRQLVERRLWPIALLLVAALIAVPVLLGKSADSASAPSPVASAADVQGQTEPIVSVADPAAREARREVLGNRKDPFRPLVKGSGKSSDAAATTTSVDHTAAAAATPSSSGGSSSGSGSGGTSAAPSETIVRVAPVTTPAPTAKAVKTYDMFAPLVKFRDASASATDGRLLKRLAGLPDVDSPALIFLGLMRDHKTAVFLVDAGATVTGDGTCAPAPDNCQRLSLKKGDIAFVDVAATATQPAARYRLDLVRVAKGETTSLKVLDKFRSAVAKGGREALRSRTDRVGDLRYSASEGILKRVELPSSVQ